MCIARRAGANVVPCRVANAARGAASALAIAADAGVRVEGHVDLAVYTDSGVGDVIAAVPDVVVALQIPGARIGWLNQERHWLGSRALSRIENEVENQRRRRIECPADRERITGVIIQARIADGRTLGCLPARVPTVSGTGSIRDRVTEKKNELVLIRRWIGMDETVAVAVPDDVRPGNGLAGGVAQTGLHVVRATAPIEVADDLLDLPRAVPGNRR